MDIKEEKTKMATRRLFIAGMTVLMLFCVSALVSEPLQDQNLLGKLDSSLSQARTYDYGTSRASLSEIDEVVKAVLGKPELRDPVEKRFLGFLQSEATLAAKQFVCQKLSVLGTKASVPVLEKMLQAENTFDMALFALERIGGPEVDTALQSALKKAKGRMQTGLINTLGMRKSVPAVKTIQKWIYDKDSQLATASLSALGHIATPEAAGVLAAAALKMTGAEQSVALDAYLKCADQWSASGDTRQAESIYQKLTASGYPPETRSAALTGLIYSASDPGQVILGVLKTGDARMKSTAIHQVSRVPNILHLKEMADVMPGMDAVHQVQLLAAFAERKDPCVLARVIDAVKSEDGQVRLAALRALERLGNASNVELIAGVAAGKETEESETAKETLYRLRGSQIDQEIMDLLPKSTPEVKVELLTAVAERHMTGAVETTIAYTKDPDPKVRQEAIKTLSIAHPNDLPKLIPVLLAAQTEAERREAERTVTLVANQIEDQDNQAKDVLAAMPGAKTIEEKGSLLNVMGRIGDSHALPEIQKALKDKDIELQKAGIRALSSWPTAKPLPDLMEIAENSKDKASQILALRGAIRLIGIDTEMSQDSKAARLQEALDLCTEPNEKRMVLSGLSKLSSTVALEMAVKMTADPELKDEAEVAFVDIENNLWSLMRNSRSRLNGIIEQTQNRDLKEKAGQMLERLQ